MCTLSTNKLPIAVANQISSCYNLKWHGKSFFTKNYNLWDRRICHLNLGAQFYLRLSKRLANSFSRDYCQPLPEKEFDEFDFEAWDICVQSLKSSSVVAFCGFIVQSCCMSAEKLLLVNLPVVGGSSEKLLFDLLPVFSYHYAYYEWDLPFLGQSIVLKFQILQHKKPVPIK